MWMRIWLKDCDIISRYLGRESSKGETMLMEGETACRDQAGQPVSRVSAGRVMAELVIPVRARQRQPY